MESAKEKRIADYVQFLKKGRTTTERFKLPVSEEQAYEYLLAANVAEVQLRHREFNNNASVDEQLRQVAKCLTADTSKYGIVLCGGCGNGKTTMLKALQNLINHMRIRNPNRASGSGTGFGDYYGLTIVSAMQVVQLCKSDYKRFLELAQTDMLGIDDLGTEPFEAMDYGNVIYPVVDLLTRRYDAQLFTVVTTNLNPKGIRARYGDRIADRLNEMMTKVVYRNPTYRTDEAPKEEPEV